MSDETSSAKRTATKRVPLLSNGLPEVFMADWIMRSPANARVGPPVADRGDEADRGPVSK